jgi:hypothetical protein
VPDTRTSALPRVVLPYSFSSLPRQQFNSLDFIARYVVLSEAELRVENPSYDPLRLSIKSQHRVLRHVIYVHILNFADLIYDLIDLDVLVHPQRNANRLIIHQAL